MPDRFARHHEIPGWNQQRLSEATVVVAGAGALGNEAAKNLALAGVGRIVICDPDVVATSNLSRCVLFRAADVDRPKVDCVARTLAEFAPDTVVEPRATDLASGVGLGELAGAAAVLGCLDSTEARLRLLGRCALVEAPLVDAGTHPWGGELRVRLRTSEPCWACTLGQEERSRTQGTPWSCDDDQPERPAAASIAGTAVVAGWMSVAALQIVFGSPPPFRLLNIDGMQGNAAAVGAQRDPGCPYHEPLAGAVDALPVSSLDTVEQLLGALEAGELPLSWEPFTGAPADGATYVSQTLSLREADPAAVLRDLGVAPAEILPVRGAEGGYRWLRLCA